MVDLLDQHDMLLFEVREYGVTDVLNVLELVELCVKQVQQSS